MALAVSIRVIFSRIANNNQRQPGTESSTAPAPCTPRQHLSVGALRVALHIIVDPYTTYLLEHRLAVSADVSEDDGKGETRDRVPNV